VDRVRHKPTYLRQEREQHPQHIFFWTYQPGDGGTRVSVSAGYAIPEAAPSDYQWVAAQVFDPDGDASEVLPSQILNGQP
jgi:hypothetical protein